MRFTLTENFTLKDMSMHFEKLICSKLAELLGMDETKIAPAVRRAFKEATEKLAQELIISRWSKVVAGVYNIDPIQLYSKTRRQPIAESRQVAMYLAAEEGRIEHNVIASHFGCGRQNVDYAVAKIRDSISVDRVLRNAVSSAKVAYYEANPIGTEDTTQV